MKLAQQENRLVLGIRPVQNSNWLHWVLYTDLMSWFLITLLKFHGVDDLLYFLIKRMVLGSIRFPQEMLFHYPQSSKTTDFVCCQRIPRFDLDNSCPCVGLLYLVGSLISEVSRND